MRELDPTPFAAALARRLTALSESREPEPPAGLRRALVALECWHGLLGRRALRDDLAWLAGLLADLDATDDDGPLPEARLERTLVGLSSPQGRGLVEALGLLRPVRLAGPCPSTEEHIASARKDLRAFLSKPDSRKRRLALARAAERTLVSLELLAAEREAWSTLDEVARAALPFLVSDDTTPQNGRVEPRRQRVRTKRLASLEATARRLSKDLLKELSPWTSG